MMTRMSRVSWTAVALSICLWWDPLAAASQLAPSQKPQAEHGMVLIPAGEFTMGSDKSDPAPPKGFVMLKPRYLDEHPAHKVNVPAFWIDAYEVTNAQYLEAVQQAKQPQPPFWEKGRYPSGGGEQPVTQVTWGDARNYCAWRGKRLPTEAEWEKAARGADSREFPWGNEFDAKKANTGLSTQQGLAPVGSFAAGKSPYGVYDMVGNVWEWVEDWYRPYPGSTYTSDYFGERMKVIRGGGWEGTHHDSPHQYRAAYRFFAPPNLPLGDGGFRCAKDAPAPAP
jgi:formylglycine-generating enzyme required for sulfatase activity